MCKAGYMADGEINTVANKFAPTHIKLMSQDIKLGDFFRLNSDCNGGLGIRLWRERCHYDSPQ